MRQDGCCEQDSETQGVEAEDFGWEAAPSRELYNPFFFQSWQLAKHAGCEVAHSVFPMEAAGDGQ